MGRPGRVLYCTVLYRTVPYCTLLYSILLYCTALHCTALLCTARILQLGTPGRQGHTAFGQVARTICSGPALRLSNPLFFFPLLLIPTWCLQVPVSSSSQVRYSIVTALQCSTIVDTRERESAQDTGLPFPRICIFRCWPPRGRPSASVCAPAQLTA